MSDWHWDEVIVAIDGGNSKTDVAVVSVRGDLLGRARGPGASPQTVGVDRAVTVFEELAVRALAAAGPTSSSRPFVRHVSAYLAGLDLPYEEETVRHALLARGWSPSVAVGNDTFALLRTGSADGTGVALVCGAGINCVGVGRDGRVHRFPALGRISGDWGGGLVLGEEALWWAVRAEDGRGPATALRYEVPRQFGLDAVTDVVWALHTGALAPAALHELCPVLFAVAAGGDTVAAAVVARLVEEVSTMVGVSLRRLAMTAEPAAVVLGGGVLTGVGPGVIAEIRRRCARTAPLADVRVAELAPVFGAALLGLDALNAGAAAAKSLMSAGLDEGLGVGDDGPDC
ncbi:BadF-type ATPase [Amycolatopsis marina]|uniref:BadF-type ATPase n=1 Tax=Amycolatopsis marina TaxID=490629 RepID=A0A1I1C9T4_9PSEU|nr:BadF/BadG/BcrA/BcrD ATPase family protein [Amycolatopsis marina]SFB57510.1 BadF-type ATPase [Amycolatopsis marina]